MVEIQGGIEENTIGLLQQFADVAMVDPLVGAMLITGAILTGFASVVFGVLAVGAVLSLLKSALPSGRAPPQQAQ